MYSDLTLNTENPMQLDIRGLVDSAMLYICYVLAYNTEDASSTPVCSGEVEKLVQS